MPAALRRGGERLTARPGGPQGENRDEQGVRTIVSPVPPLACPARAAPAGPCLRHTSTGPRRPLAARRYGRLVRLSARRLTPNKSPPAIPWRRIGWFVLPPPDRRSLPARGPS